MVKNGKDLVKKLLDWQRRNLKVTVPEVKHIPCEFARDCLTPDGEYCPKFPDPNNCGKYHIISVAEEEETYEEFQAWVSKNKPCWGVGNDDEKKCRICEMSESCLEECEARAERSCAWL